MPRFRDSRGATSAEYALIAALIAMAVVGPMYWLNKELRFQYSLAAAMAQFAAHDKTMDLAFEKFDGDDDRLELGEFSDSFDWFKSQIGGGPPPEQYPEIFDELDKDDSDDLDRSEYFPTKPPK